MVVEDNRCSSPRIIFWHLAIPMKIFPSSSSSFMLIFCLINMVVDFYFLFFYLDVVLSLLTKRSILILRFDLDLLHKIFTF